MMLSYANDCSDASADRVRRSTPNHLNEKIDRQMKSNIQCYANSNQATIQNRIAELDTE